jgi:hypothetical protein
LIDSEVGFSFVESKGDNRDGPSATVRLTGAAAAGPIAIVPGDEILGRPITKRAGIYLRVSTGDQTVENQRQALIEAVAHQGWRVVEEFVDSGVSGAKGRDKRPPFDRLCKAVAAWSVDRLGRSLQDLVGLLGELNGAGCDLYL